MAKNVKNKTSKAPSLKKTELKAPVKTSKWKLRTSGWLGTITKLFSSKRAKTSCAKTACAKFPATGTAPELHAC